MEIRWGRMTTSQAFEPGDVIAIVDAGTITEPPQDATEVLIGTDGEIFGIAATGPYANGQAMIDPSTGAAYAANARVAFYPCDQGNLFITDNLFAAAGGSQVTPALTDIGETYQVTYGTGTTNPSGWGLERTAGVTGTDLLGVVYDVLDTNKKSIVESGSTGSGVYVVFELKAGN
jgi:hypothetical protein